MAGVGRGRMTEVTNTGSDRAQLANIASRAKDVLGVEKLEVVADRDYYSGEEILTCDKAGIAVTLPNPMTSGLEVRGRFCKQVCLSEIKHAHTDDEVRQEMA
jgi:hypothetical protein